MIREPSLFILNHYLERKGVPLWGRRTTSKPETLIFNKRGVIFFGRAEVAAHKGGKDIQNGVKKVATGGYQASGPMRCPRSSPSPELLKGLGLGFSGFGFRV